MYFVLYGLLCLFPALAKNRQITGVARKTRRRGVCSSTRQYYCKYRYTKDIATTINANVGKPTGNTTIAMCLQGEGTAMTVNTLRILSTVAFYCGIWPTQHTLQMTTHNAVVMSFFQLTTRCQRLEPNANGQMVLSKSMCLHRRNGKQIHRLQR